MKDFKIIRAELNVLDELARLFDLYRQFYEQTPDLEQARDFLHDRISNNESLIFVAVDSDGEMLGFCQIYPSYCSVMAAPIYVLYDLFVLSSKRKGGIGRALLLAAEEQAKSAGIRRLDLTTAKTNFPAQSLYESLGWKRDEVFFTYNRLLNNERNE